MIKIEMLYAHKMATRNTSTVGSYGFSGFMTSGFPKDENRKKDYNWYPKLTQPITTRFLCA